MSTAMSESTLLGDSIPTRWEPPDSTLLDHAECMPSLPIDSASLADLELLCVGAYLPLRTYLGQADYRSVLDTMRLADGRIWPLPVQLPVTTDDAWRTRNASEVALKGPDGEIYGTIRPLEVFACDALEEARSVFGTEDLGHPGVARLFAQPGLYISGPVRLLRRTPRTVESRFYLDPADTREEFQRRGWSRIVGFQTRNPIHRAHEYILKCALEICDGLLLHPLTGETKSDDIPASVRMTSYRVLLEGYFPIGRVLLSVFPAAMRYAGPREAVFHALVRRNYGCTHFIVGRDHAGVGNYYGTYDAQRIFERFEADALAITPVFFEHSFYCARCQGMASPKTCPHDAGDHLTLSGTRVREMLAGGMAPPPEYTRPEVAEILLESARFC